MTNVDHDVLIATLDRLKLTAIRDQLDTLLDDDLARGAGFPCVARDRPARRAADIDVEQAGAVPVRARIGTASTSRRSPRWIRGRSGSWACRKFSWLTAC